MLTSTLTCDFRLFIFIKMIKKTVLEHVTKLTILKRDLYLQHLANIYKQDSNTSGHGIFDNLHIMELGKNTWFCHCSYNINHKQPFRTWKNIVWLHVKYPFYAMLQSKAEQSNILESKILDIEQIVGVIYLTIWTLGCGTCWQMMHNKCNSSPGSFFRFRIWTTISIP